MDIEISLINNHQKAIDYAKRLLTKEEYEHTLRVTEVIYKKNLDPKAIDAAILHDFLYLKKISYDELKEEFGNETCELVKEITLIEELLIKNYSKLDSATLSSLILSVSSDLRTIIIQLVEVIDLLKNNAGHQTDIKKLAKISEEIYYPISIKLGLSDFSSKLQDYSFKILNNEGYQKVKKLINKDISEREKKIEEFVSELEELFLGRDIKIYGRPKNFKSIYNKLSKVSIKKMYDIYGIRIICNKERECYEILGIIHSKYDFIKEAFDDYITKEGKGAGKEGYQSLHTAIKKDDDIFEIQIRTWQMHMRTESSIYWEYKRLKKDKNFEEELSWERQLIEWQKSIGEKNNKRKVLNKKIFAFTPKGEVIPLKIGATVLDFAFAIHTEVGKKAKGGVINGKLVPLETKIENLDHVEIITDQKYTIKKNWLSIVTTEKASQKIRAYFNLKPTSKKSNKQIITDNVKKIKLAECCHPLPGEDVIGVKTTKRKIIIHKTDCQNIKNIDKKKLVEIGFEKSSGKTKIYIRAIDRIGLLSEILNTFKKEGIILRNTNFSIKKSGFVDAIFEVEVKSAQKIDDVIEKLNKIPSIENAQRQ